MKITEDRLECLAEACRLRFSPEELERLVSEFQAIFNDMDRIENIPDDAGAGADGISFAHAPMREDHVWPSLPCQVLRKNASGWKDGYFVLPGEA